MVFILKENILPKKRQILQQKPMKTYLSEGNGECDYSSNSMYNNNLTHARQRNTDHQRNSHKPTNLQTDLQSFIHQQDQNISILANYQMMVLEVYLE